MRVVGRHPVASSILALALVTIPGAISDWWGLFDDRPFVVFIGQQIGGSTVWLIDPIRFLQVAVPLLGLLLFGFIVVSAEKQVGQAPR